MNLFRKYKIVIFSLLFIAIIAIGVYELQSHGIKVVYTGGDSMPKGFYLIIPAKTYNYEDMVVFTPPPETQTLLTQQRWAPNNGWLLKYVMALPGDTVCIYQNNIWINHKKFGKVYNYYAPGKLLPRLSFCDKLDQHQYFLLSNKTERSFDGRYFGPINDNKIIGKARAIYEQK